MTYTDGSPPTPTTTHAAAWEACDHCQAPLAERQRYCVVCGARRANADDPAARYFVAAARSARAAEAAPAPDAAARASSSPSRMWFAIVFALLPVVAALGIVVGRGNGNDQQLVDALKAQKAPVVNVVGGTGGGTATADTSSGSAGRRSSGAKVDKARSSAAGGGEVIAHTRYGNARSLTDSRVTSQQLEESRRALDHIVNSKGRAYVESQRDLPDQIVIP